MRLFAVCRRIFAWPFAQTDPIHCSNNSRYTVRAEFEVSFSNDSRDNFADGDLGETKQSVCEWSTILFFGKRHESLAKQFATRLSR